MEGEVLVQNQANNQVQNDTRGYGNNFKNGNRKGGYYKKVRNKKYLI